GHGDMSMAIHAFRIGAADFLEKNVTSEELQAAVKKAVTASMKNFSSNCEKKKLLELYESLTPREKQVCVGVAQGKLNKVIAYELDIAERTVKMHRSHLLEKLEVKSPVELAFLLKSIGVLDAE
ncbi:response regulator transcription factor, partial [Turicimonas muris]